MASSRNTALRPHFKELAIPSGIPLTPAVCTEIFAQFLKQILYRRGQIECTFEQYMKLHTANQEKPRLTAKELKVHHLFKTMRECTESMLKIFEHHYQHRQCHQQSESSQPSQSSHSSESSPPSVDPEYKSSTSSSSKSDNIDNIESIDILVLFGKSYMKPLEIYSLRFFLIQTDDIKSEMTDKTKRKLAGIIARNLHDLHLHDISEDDLPKTDCRVMANVNPSECDQELIDLDFMPKHNVVFRRNKKQSLFTLNVWNRRTSKFLVNSLTASIDGADKENVTSILQLHDVEEMMKGAQSRGTDMDSDEEADDDDERLERSWYLSAFKFKGI